MAPALQEPALGSVRCRDDIRDWSIVNRRKRLNDPDIADSLLLPVDNAGASYRTNIRRHIAHSVENLAETESGFAPEIFKVSIHG